MTVDEMRWTGAGLGRGIGGAVAAVVAFVVAPVGVGAQDLPSAAELESEAPQEESEEEGDSAKAKESTSSESGAEKSKAAEGEDREKTPGAEEKSGDKAAKKSDDGEGKAKKGEEKKGEEDKRGKIVNTETDVEREVEGRGAVEGDPRWVQSGVNAYGLPGFQHITSASPNRANTYDVSFFGEVTSGQNMIRHRDTNTFVGGRLNVHAQIIEYFSANLAIGATNNVNNFGRPEAMLSQGDLTTGLRGHYPVQDFLDVGADVTVGFPTGFGSAGLDFAGTSVRPRLLSTLNVDPLVQGTTLPLSAHLNVGYRVDNTANTVPEDVRLTRVERFAHGISDYDYLELGVGVEYDVPYVSPFASWNLDIPLNGPAGICGRVGLDCLDEFGFQAFPNVVSVGLRGEPVDQLSLHAGADVRLTSQQAAGIPWTPPYMVVVGANWKIDPRARVERVTKTVEKTRLVKEAPERGYLVGTVVDAKSGEPVGGAQIAYVNTERSPQMSGSENGSFRSYGFPTEKEVTVRVTHPKYHSKEVTGKLQKGEQSRKFELKPKPQKGVVKGTVTDKEGKGIANATVRLAGPELKETTTDSNGGFEVEVEAGKYGIGATSKDHLAANKTVEIPAGGSSSVEFALEEGGDPSLVKIEEDQVKVDEKIHFEFGTAKLSENSHEILDQVASTLKSHPELTRIQIAGHTDNVGTKEENMKLSKERAQAVYSYLIQEGVSQSRLVSKGYGPTQPLVPNISKKNRALNRRVEFRIQERRAPKSGGDGR